MASFLDGNGLKRVWAKLTDKFFDVETQIDGRQARLVSGSNIKTINGTSLLGSGNIDVGSPTIVQATGTSTTSVMSQKAVTDQLALKADALPSLDQERAVGSLNGYTVYERLWWKELALPSGGWAYFQHNIPAPVTAIVSASVSYQVKSDMLWRTVGGTSLGAGFVIDDAFIRIRIDDGVNSAATAIITVRYVKGK